MSDPTDLPVPDPAADAVPEAPAPTGTDAQATPTADTAAADSDNASSAQPVADPAADTAADTDTDTDTDPTARTAAAVSEADADPAESSDAAPGPGKPAPPQLNPAAAAELLRQHFPALFSGPAKPFKLRIQQDIQARAPGVFSKGTLSAFFRRHTGSTGYLIGLSKSVNRFDLNGQPAGELSDEHKQAAVAELARRRLLTREREQQAQSQQRAQHLDAQRAEMARQAEQMQARQARAALLRDFQRTTLTLANFCALKGMTPEVLNPQLEQAKKEAAEAPPMPAHTFDDRRPGQGAQRPGGRGDRPAGPGGRLETQGRTGTPGAAEARSEGQARPGARPEVRTPRRDNRSPRGDDRRPAPAGAAPTPRGPRGPSGQS